MRMSDEEYFRSCVAQERHLAYLLGHHNIEECYESAGTLWENTQALPQWTRDWNACGPLMTKYEITLHYESEAGQVHGSAVTIGKIVVHFSDHPTKDQAVRYAVVKAVIFLLEHPKAGKFK
ncbi:MAG: aminoacyl-tRNA synthetase [Burkholderiales bacterium RIFCSPLOWO2_02_FULL_57_36]|nr:MAG: aminoacyl-tRNA synthetase [Burkholderiales bacterium RIFCSPLOWO2_02_FULL_57_36]